MHEHAPVAAMGRETMMRAVDAWAKRSGVEVLVVFDGGKPMASLLQQMVTRRVSVRFSGGQTADDVIIKLVEGMKPSQRSVIVSADKAILREAKVRRCPVMDSVTFVGEVFAKGQPAKRPEVPTGEKPTQGGDVDAWLDEFGIEDVGDDGELFDGEEFMKS